MKFVLTSVGTRGDMEPFLAIGQLLKAQGHQVICAFPDQFRAIAKGAELDFASLGASFIELLNSEAGKAAMGGATGFKQVKGTLQLAFRQKAANKELLFYQREIIEREMPDRVLYNGKAIYPILWGLKNEGKAIFISPLPYMHYVKGHTHVAFNSNYGEFFNKLTFSLARFGLIATLKMGKKWLKIKTPVPRSALRDALLYNKTIYTISPSLFARPADWHPNLQVLGFWGRQAATTWQASEELNQFLKRHDKVLFVTFGSMLNAAPTEKTTAFLEVLERHKIPAIFNCASGGLVEPASYNSELFHFVSSIPYDWILPKVYGIVHHGGSGTTHLALQHGCASLIIPHIIDQFVWNRIVHEKGAGPKGIKIGKVKAVTLEPLILDLFNRSDYKLRAVAMAKQMNQEDFQGELFHTILEG